MYRLRMFALAVAVLVLSPVGNGSLAATDEESIRKMIGEYVETWNRQDVDAFADLFAADTHMVILNAQVWKGREDIHNHLSFLFGKVPAGSAKVSLPPQAHGAFKTVTYRFDDVYLKFIHKDVAVAHVSWTQMGDPRFKDKPRTGVLTLVANRDGERWIFSAFQNTARP